MPNKTGSEAQRAIKISELSDTTVNISSDSRLIVEFRIDDLIKKLAPGGFSPVANCGGCHGCSGCSM
jgi:hypothetical protein